MLQVGRRACHPHTLLRHLHAASQVLCQPRNHTQTYRESCTDYQEGTVSHLRNNTNGAQLYLVGTAHVSAKSAEEVRQVRSLERPGLQFQLESVALNSDLATSVLRSSGRFTFDYGIQRIVVCIWRKQCAPIMYQFWSNL